MRQSFTVYNTQIKSTGMGKGDKKTRRGKIVLGTYGVRRRRKKGAILSKPSKTAREKETPRKRPVREKSEVKAGKKLWMKNLLQRFRRPPGRRKKQVKLHRKKNQRRRRKTRNNRITNWEKNNQAIKQGLPVYLKFYFTGSVS